MADRTRSRPGDDAGPSTAKMPGERTEVNARARAMKALLEARVPFVVGGAYAYAHYTGIHRETKDLDLFIRPPDADRALNVLAANGWTVEGNVHGWLHKAFWEDYLVDLIYGAGNGIANVDDAWIAHGQKAEILGHECRVSPPEEIIWSKAFVQERERFDGAELNHLILRAGPTLDWTRLLRRFDRYWEVLLGHLMFFRFVYPSDRDRVPAWVMNELLSRTVDSVRHGNWSGEVCRGRLISIVNYQVDLEEWGYQDGRRWDEAERRAGRPHPELVEQQDPPI